MHYTKYIKYVRVLSLLSSLIMVLWQSPDTPFLSCFLVSAQLRVCLSRALSCLCALFHVGAWYSRHSCLVSGPVLVSCRGFGHSRSRFGLAVGACGLEFARAVRSFVHVHLLSLFWFLLFCLVLYGTQLVFFTVWHCSVFMLLCLSCFVWTRLMSLLISWMSCFAHGYWFCFAGHMLVFLFCVSTWLLS